MQTERGALNCSTPSKPKTQTPKTQTPKAQEPITQGSKTQASTTNAKPKRRSRRKILPGPTEFFLWAIALVIVAPIAGVAYLRYQGQFLEPPVALVLGGAPEREQFAAQFAKAHPSVRIWVSSGSNPEYARWVFDQAQVPNEQWALDYQAVDTVTNFTTLVDKLEDRQIDQVYLITSDYHMRRASVIAQIVLGSRGINFKPVAIPTEHDPEQPETLTRDVRDGVRSLLWVMTGKTGSEWKSTLRQSAQQ
ncbi:MAG: YdcF family protein [Cyanobacteria bacterium P01_D01_bin.105]